MVFSCRERNAMELEELLGAGDTSIRIAATAMNRSARYIHSLVKEWPMRFSCIGIKGPVASWCIGLASDRPIYLVLKEAVEAKEG